MVELKCIKRINVDVMNAELGKEIAIRNIGVDTSPRHVRCKAEL